MNKLLNEILKSPNVPSGASQSKPDAQVCGSGTRCSHSDEVFVYYNINISRVMATGVTGAMDVWVLCKIDRRDSKIDAMDIIHDRWNENVIRMC